MTELGDQLRSAIAGRGMSVRAAARQAGYSAGYLSNVIHGRKPLTPSMAARLDRALGTGDLLSAYALRHPSGNPGARQAGYAAAGPAACRPGEPGGSAQWLHEFTAADLASPQSGHVDEPTVCAGEALLRAAELAGFGQPGSWPVSAPAAGRMTEEHARQIEAATAVFRSWDNAYGGGLRRKAVIGQLAEVTSLLAGPFASGQAARRMYSAAADLAQLAGWMSWDLRLHGVAQRYYLLALGLARDAGDRPQAARLMYCLARQQIDLDHPREALELAAAGSYAIRRAPSPRASALLHIAQARAHACAGEEQECRATLGAAQDAYAGDGADPAWCGFFDESQLRGLTGVVLRDLAANSPGRAARVATEARAWIEQAAATRPSAFMRSKVLDTDGIAVTSILAHEPDRAAAAVSEAITLSCQVHSPRAAGRLRATIGMGTRAFPRDAAWPALYEEARSLPAAR